MTSISNHSILKEVTCVLILCTPWSEVEFEENGVAAFDRKERELSSSFPGFWRQRQWRVGGAGRMGLHTARCSLFLARHTTSQGLLEGCSQAPKA